MFNSFEGKSRRVVFVCSAGILRSPTAAKIAWQEYGWNTRAAGAYPYALIPVTAQLIEWADDIYCMEKEHKSELMRTFEGLHPESKITVLHITDDYDYMNEELITILKHRLRCNPEVLNEFM